LDIQTPHNEIELHQNPMLELGFGMNAYFKMIKYMLILMFWVCLANLPLFWIFSQYDTYETMPLASLSMGNMGGAMSICQ